MSQPVPRAIYWRRRLLLVAAGILLVWVVLQLWPNEEPTKPAAQPSASPSSTATPAAATATPTPTPSVPVQPTTAVTLNGGGKACDPQLVRIAAYVADGQLAQQPVQVDLSISTTADQPCVFKPKTYDPLAIVSRGDKRVWDSSVCDAPVAAGSVQLTPNWATIARVPWMPRRSGTSCADTEAWLDAGAYTLEIGTLGGEPGKASFELAAPPPPPPPPTPAATPEPPAVPPPAAPAEKPRKKKSR